MAGRARWADSSDLFQLDGRLRARERDPLHQAGCMLYWAEGKKERNSVTLVNSDVHLVRFFRRFLSECFDVSDGDFAISLHLYTGNGLSVADIERYWLTALELPRSALRKHSINVRPASSKGSKVNRLPYGVCSLRLRRSTHIVQHIYGAIQEYGSFENPAWLD
jgi:hypothetical protein